jgi:hypothetical protein
MKRFVAEGLNERCCVFEVLIPPSTPTVGKRLLQGKRVCDRDDASSGVGRSAIDDTTRSCLQVRSLALSKMGLLHIVFFLILSELE